MNMEDLNTFCQSPNFHDLVIYGYKSAAPGKNSWWEHIEAIQERAAEAAIWQSSYAIEYLQQQYPDIDLVQPRWEQSETGIVFDVLIQRKDGSRGHYTEYDTQPGEIPEWASNVDDGKVFNWAIVIMEEAITNTIYNTFEMATEAFSGTPQMDFAQIRDRSGGHFEAAWQAYILECATPNARSRHSRRRV